MKKKIDLRFGFLILLIFGAAISRLLPHPPNLTPIGAMGLFGAAYFSRRWLAFLVPFAALWVSDLLLNNLVYARQFPELYEGFAWFGSPSVYLAFGLIVLLGFGLLKRVKPLRLLGASLGASIVFFLLTNFFSWLGNPLYPQTTTGLMTAYAMGVPFFWNTLFGDLLYTALLFGIFEWVQQKHPAWALPRA